MAIQQFALVAALLPVVAFAANTTVAPAAWNASNAAALLLANAAGIPAAIDTAAGTSVAKVAGLAMTGLTCVPSGPAASGAFVLTMTSSTAALADAQFPRWIAKAFASFMGCSENQVDVTLTAVRRLTTEGRRLPGTTTVNGAFNVYNPNRGRNIALGIGLGVVAPAVGLGVGLGLGLDRDVQPTTPAPVNTPIPATAAPLAPVPIVTEAPEEGSSIPFWPWSFLLLFACLACIGAAIMAMSKGKKKKAPKKKAAPVMEEIRVVEEVAPLMTYQPTSMQVVQQPMQYMQQPVQQPVYTSMAGPMAYQQAPVYAAPQQAYQQVGGSVRMF